MLLKVEYLPLPFNEGAEFCSPGCSLRRVHYSVSALAWLTTLCVTAHARLLHSASRSSPKRLYGFPRSRHAYL